MQIDHATYEQARLSRDARFDGRFFVAVKTTGIYCRPVCPAPLPKARNVRFYPTAAAAAEAGFRPCLRCRPESAPGAPVWLGTPATVLRALRMIEAGALDEGSIEVLSDRLGIGPRHLHRLFVRHLGAPPVAVAQVRRLQIAKKLLDETALPVTQIAFAAGFGSLRRFNHTFQKTYGCSPTRVRRNGTKQGSRLGGVAGAIELRLQFRPPYDWDSLLGFLAPRTTPGIEQVDGASYRRTIALGRQQGWIEVTPHRRENCLLLRVRFPDPRKLYTIAHRVRRLFDLDAVPEEISRHLRGDKLLAPVLRAHPGLRVPGAWDGFELAVRAVLGQQVTVRGATTLAARLAKTYGDPATEAREGLSLLFPTPERLSRARLASIGLPRARARTINLLARAVAAGEIRFELFSDCDELVKLLLAIPGIGQWTAQYVAMRALGDTSAFPAGDLGLLRAASSCLGDGRPITARVLEERSERWRPWRAYAAMHLWKKLERTGK